MQSLYSSLVDYWPLHEASGDRSSGIGRNTLTDNNTVTQAAGRAVYAAQFTRANSERLSVANNGSIGFGDIDFTFACWLYLDNKTNSQNIFTKDDGSSQRDYRLIYNQAVDRFQFEVFRATDSAVTLSAGALGAPTAATWYFCVCWHDAAADTMSIEINARLQNSQATGGALQAAQTSALGIGGADSAANYMDGRVCEAAMWRRVLTLQERWWLYNNGLGRTYPFDGRMSPVALGRGVVNHRRNRLTGMAV